MIAALWSVEPESQQINSQFVNVCARRLSRPFRTFMMTLTCGVGRDSCVIAWPSE
jgi:hypothetical protein